MQLELNLCGYSLHKQPFNIKRVDTVLTYILRLQTDGNCIVIYNGKRITVEKGTFLLVRPGDSYELIVDNPNSNAKIHSEDYHIICGGTWIEDWAEDKINQQIFHIENFENIVSIWKMLILETRKLSKYNDKDLSNSLLQTICLLISRSLNEQDSLRNHPFVVKRMMRYIEEHAATSLKVEDIASYVSLSVSRSSFLFKNHTGKSMMEYALEVRLNIAVEKMKFTSETLEKIAEDSGFNTYNYFHKVFKKKYKKSPGDYRKQEKDFYYLL